MPEKFKKSIDKGNIFGALLTDLSKIFDCIDHTLLIIELFPFVISRIIKIDIHLFNKLNATYQN